MKKMKFCLALSAFIFLCITSRAQDHATTEGGKLTLGLRSNTSLFSDEGSSGTGVGGQFRLRFLKKINTEWFADYIRSDVRSLARRTDGHIGWSVMFDMIDPSKQTFLSPYIVAGHCFDYTSIVKTYSKESQSRWSSAINMGAGTHFNLSKKVDLSLASLYMLHLGDDIETEPFQNAYGNEDLRIVKGDLGLEGHLFLIMSVNLQVADLW
jgi:hypothetical protein